ncbi:MAG: LysM peptidoglycan-binding domain-containing protein, partial [Deltaproteobacteria bacterium]|nr:LysM peptidoglycan-binding domain-containing protein [Deltaproteobacteria bacterium]
MPSSIALSLIGLLSVAALEWPSGVQLYAAIEEGTGSTINLTKTVEVYSYEDLIFTIDDYVVSPGDNIEWILKKQGLWPTDMAPGREAQIIRLVSELNPAIANLDLISPGQNLYLPIAKPVEEPKVLVPQEDPLSSDVVTYELKSPAQSPATVLVRRPGASAAALPEGTWALRVDRGGGVSEESPYLRGTPNIVPENTADIPSPSPQSKRRNSSRPRKVNEGPIETLTDGTVYRTVKVKNGDTLEKLLRREGLDPNLIYRHLIKLTLALNPNIKSRNMIFIGAELRIPAQGVYLAKYDPSYVGDSEMDLAAVRYAQAGTTATDAGPVSPNSNSNLASTTPSSRTQRNSPGKFQINTKRLPAAPFPTADSQNARQILGIIFTRLGEQVVSKGRLFLPLDEPPHFDVDTASMPVIDLRNGRHVILDLQRSLKPDFIKRFREKYQDYMVFQPTKGEPMAKALERLWPLCGYYRVYTKDKSFEGGRDVKLKISADWLVWPTSSDWNKGQPIVINLAPSQDNGTPTPWVKFLAEHNIFVIDLYRGQLLAGQNRGATPLNNFTVIDLENDNPSAFAAALVKSFGFTPRIGVKVDLVAGRITTGGESLESGKTPPIFWELGTSKTILEYGQLTTEELNTLRQNDFQVISSARDSQSVLKSILAALNIKLNGPLVLNGASSGGPDITLTISGQTFPFNNRTYLFTPVNLPTNLTSLDPNQNVVVLKYRETAVPPPVTQRPPAAQPPIGDEDQNVPIVSE